MSGEIINLRRVKKNIAREDAAKHAGENRIKFGLNKSEKKVAAFQKEHATKKLDGHKLEK